MKFTKPEQKEMVESRIESSDRFNGNKAFDTDCQYLSFINVSDYKKVNEDLVKLLIKNTKIPFNTPYEIRASLACDFGRKQGISVYYNPYFRKEHGDTFLNVDSKTWERDQDKSYYLIGRGVI